MTAGQTNNSIDAVFAGGGTGTSTSTIGDFVWHDVNKNGIQDANEPGLANVTIMIAGTSGFRKTTVTNANGMYLFTDIVAGTYTVKLSASAGYSSSPANQDTDDTKDSNPVNGSATVTVATEVNNLTIDAGFCSIPAPPPSTGCLGNMTTGNSGYYGGFEAGQNNISATTGGSDLYNGLPRNGSYQIVKSVDDLGGGGYLNVRPHGGSYFLAADTSNDEIDRVWYTMVSVKPGQTVNFCASVTLLKNLGDGANYILGVYANGIQMVQDE